MTFDNPEVIELGVAENLIQDIPWVVSTEGTVPSKAKFDSTIYVADAE